MHIETKFGNGDVVFYATTHSARKTVPCKECNETGRLKVEGKNFTVACRDCGGDGHFYTWSEIDPSTEMMTVGQVRVEITDSPGKPGGSVFSNYGPQSERKESYMCIESGIGSGSLYDVEDLFATREEALERAKEKVIRAREYQAEMKAREEQRLLDLAKDYESTDEET